MEKIKVEKNDLIMAAAACLLS